MTNHDADNVIEFTPRFKGTFKILVKQPELEEAQNTDENFAIEIGVTKSDGGSGHDELERVGEGDRQPL